MTDVPPLPDFRSPAALRAHIAETMAFYHPRCIDPDGGFFHYFRDDGSVYDASHRHLVSSTRFVFDYAMAANEFADDAALKAQYVDAVHHGVAWLRERHFDAESGGYAWTIRDGVPEDRSQQCYGAAFVLLAYACAAKVGIAGARGWMDETWQLLERRYWEPEHGLYRDEATRDWVFSGYRGQNANMHLCEAMLAAYEGSGERRYLDRALLLADHMTRRQAAQAGGLVWEHYHRDWTIDRDFNRDDPRNLFKPWGFQPGHQTEWTKLLVILDGHLREAGEPVEWLLPKARALFDEAVAKAWDEDHGGLVYGFAPIALRAPGSGGRELADGETFVCDEDKYFWVQAESLAAAARLALATGDDGYWRWYDRLWAYAWTHFVDHEHGAWFRILDRENRKYDDLKSPAGKTDYHTMGACHDVLAALRRKD